MLTFASTMLTLSIYTEITRSLHKSKPLHSVAWGTTESTFLLWMSIPISVVKDLFLLSFGLKTNIANYSLDFSHWNCAGNINLTQITRINLIQIRSFLLAWYNFSMRMFFTTSYAFDSIDNTNWIWYLVTYNHTVIRAVKNKLFNRDGYNLLFATKIHEKHTNSIFFTAFSL